MKSRGAPKHLGANGLWNHFTGKKKYTVVCGGCGHTYKDKVPFSASDTASSVCVSCARQNVWSHSGWERVYNHEMGLVSVTKT